jgi:hypothetical protein
MSSKTGQIQCSENVELRVQTINISERLVDDSDGGLNDLGVIELTFA